MILELPNFVRLVRFCDQFRLSRIFFQLFLNRLINPPARRGVYNLGFCPDMVIDKR